MNKRIEYNVETQTFKESEISEEEIEIQEKQDKINKMQRKTSILKQQISDTDYKIIKCYEYNLVGLELPYDISELHRSRQSMRDEINALEKELKEGEVVE